MKKYLFSLNLTIIFLSLIYGIFSGGIKNNFNNRQEGERLFILLNVKFGNEIILKKTGFRYFNFELVLNNNKLVELREILSRKGYSTVNNGTYCKNGNAVFLSFYKINTELRYEYESDYCR
ncbi:hypothetical protein ACT2CV_09375 [Pasteurellaceae bacterium 22721_9_1]